MSKIPITYIQMFWEEAKQSRVECVSRTFCGWRILQITFYNDFALDDKRWKKQIRRCNQKLRKWNVTETTFCLDEKLELVLERQGLSHLARKRELLQNRYPIMQFMKQKVAGDDEGLRRHSFILYVDSVMWNCQELRLLLIAAKDYFEDLYVYVADQLIGVDFLKHTLYEQWGVVVTVCGKEQVIASYDAACYLTKDWKTCNNGSDYKVAYYVSENKCDYDTQSIMGMTNIYAGLRYVCKDIEIPYQMAVDLLYQSNKKSDKTEITPIAICDVK